MDKKSGPAAVGGSSLLVIFAVLCLVVFALLSASTVQADGRLSKASADAVTAYYEADCKAEEILSQLRSGTVPPGVEMNGSHFYYECPVSETQTLIVSGILSGDFYEILQWQTVSVTEWGEDDSLDLWDGTT